MKPTLYVGDVGTAIVLDCVEDISAASALAIQVLKPDGSTATWPAVAEGTTALRFDTLAGTIDMWGLWRLQPVVTLPGGTWRGKLAELFVYEPLP